MNGQPLAPAFQTMSHESKPNYLLATHNLRLKSAASGIVEPGKLFRKKRIFGNSLCNPSSVCLHEILIFRQTSNL
jgi:hypothetical protein